MWADILLLSILLVCVITDLKSRKIYNKIIFPSLVIAFFTHLLLEGWSALFHSIIAFFIGIAILLIPYLLGGMGAGDVKLLALIGAIKGTLFVFYTAVYMGLIGGVIAIGVLLFRNGVLFRLKSIYYFFMSWRFGFRVPLIINQGGMTSTYPYGVAIAGGALVCLMLKGGFFL